MTVGLRFYQVTNYTYVCFFSLSQSTAKKNRERERGDTRNSHLTHFLPDRTLEQLANNDPLDEVNFSLIFLPDLGLGPRGAKLISRSLQHNTHLSTLGLGCMALE